MSIVFMRVLESSPSRYDRGIKILTLGKLDKIYDIVGKKITNNSRILDVGCGTGKLSVNCLRGKQAVTLIGIDINPQMLDLARERFDSLPLEDKVEFKEMGVAEIDQFENQSFDYVVSGLCFSELSEHEREYAIKEIAKLLTLKGKLIIVDEVRPRTFYKKMLYWIIKIPLIIITYLISQTTTKPLDIIQIQDYLQQNRLEVRSKELFLFESLIILEIGAKNEKV